jgi:hypothetical protein
MACAVMDGERSDGNAGSRLSCQGGGDELFGIQELVVWRVN